MRLLHRFAAGSALVLALAVARPAAAQTVGTPVYMAPYRAFNDHEVGGMISDPGPGLALEGAYRYGYQRFDIGIRGGLLSRDRPGDDATSLLAGADVRFRVIDHSLDFPLDGALTLGFGAAIGDFSQAYLPVGLSLGRRVELEGGTSFVPYVQPVLAPTFGDGDDELLLAIGLGVDWKVTRRLDIRLSGGVGDIDGIAIGLSWIR